MGNLTANKKTLDKYFGILKSLDTGSKKKLIDRLSKSIRKEKKGSFKLDEIYGAWQDSKSADEIIDEITKSRTKN